jgi:dolichol-phosphate mannosyltransferase
LVSRGGTFLARLMLRATMSDMTSGFECFNRTAMQVILKNGVASKANFFQTEIRLMMHRFRWMEVPITYQNKNFRIGRSGISEAFRILWQLRSAVRHNRSSV